MNAAWYERIVGLVILFIAVIWSVVVHQTIPAGYSDNGVGPRFFPLFLGIVLTGLSLLMVVRSFFMEDEEDAAESEACEPPPKRADRREIWLTAATFLIVVLYGFLLDKTGFVVATPIVIVAMMLGVLDIRRPVLVSAMAFGITAVSWLVFSEFLGVYLPRGSWISLV